MKRNSLVLDAVIYFICLHLVRTTKVCYSRDIFGKVTYIICADSCCGSLEDKYCCQNREVGIAVGCIVGVIVFFAIALAVINCCCCNRNRRKGYTEIPEGPDNQGSGTYYDIPRTPSGPPLVIQETFSEANEAEPSLSPTTANVSEINTERNVDSVQVLVEEVACIDSNRVIEESIENEKVIEDIQEKTPNNEVVDSTIIAEVVSTSEAIATQEKFDAHTPTIIVTDTDTANGRYAYVEITPEHSFSENCTDSSGTKILIEDGNSTCISNHEDGYEEFLSDCKPLLQETNHLERKTDVYVDNNTRRKILITDLDTDTTEEITDFTLSGEESALPYLTTSQEESVSSDLTVSQTSNLTVVIHEGSSWSDTTTSQGESILPDLTVSKEETSLQESSETEEFRTTMGNNQPTERLIDNQTYTAEPYQPAGMYATSSSDPSNSAEAYLAEEPRTEVFDNGKLASDANQPYDVPPANAYNQPVPYDPGPAQAYAYNQPAGMTAYNQAFGNQPVDAYQYNQPTEYESTFQDNEPYPSDTTEIFEAADDRPSDSYEEFTA